MKSMIAASYALGAYVVFLGTILYAIGFVGNFIVPRSIDADTQAPVLAATAIDLALLAVFALQHSIMARPAFKRWWTRFVPQAVERSTFVLCASAALLLLYWQWQPILTPIWIMSDPTVVHLLHGMFWLGWVLVFVSTFLISHFELFGLHQVWAVMRGRALPAATFKTPGLYKYVRHPIYLGFVLAFWSTPAMTAGHLLFAVATTGYILIGIWFEERDLIAQFGDRYRRYREQVGMLWPKLSRKRRLDPAIQ